MVFKDIFYAVKSPASYGAFLKKKGWKVFLYGIFLVTIYFLLVNALPVVRFQTTWGGFRYLAERMIPDFELSGGKLYVEDTFYLDQAGVYVDVDTSMEWVEARQEEIEDILWSGDYSTVLISDSSRMAIKNNGRVQMVDWEDLEGMEFSKEDIYRYLPMINMILVLVMVLWYIMDIILFFAGALIISLFALIVKAAVNVRLTFGQVFLLSIYARTAPLVIKAILNTFHIIFPFYGMASAIISIVYLSLAFKKIKEDREREGQLEKMEESWRQGGGVWKQAEEANQENLRQENEDARE